MSVARHLAAFAAAIGLMIAPIAAQAQPGGTIPDQSWYPEGYLDMRVAAAHQLADFPRNENVVLFEDFDDPEVKTYDVIDCNLAYDLSWEMDSYQRQIGSLALDIARMRSEFARIGYPQAVYDRPLIDYERAALAAFAAERPDRLANPENYRIRGEDGEDYGESVDMQDWELLGALAEAMDAKRAALSPRLPRIVSEGGCGAGEEEFEIKLVPANGSLWLINAFAFRVCERKVANPWNHQACGWSEFQAGDSTFASGRYMYEARWPNGTVKRGARVLQADFDNDETGAVIFRRD